jgi:hypothetical protein
MASPRETLPNRLSRLARAAGLAAAVTCASAPVVFAQSDSTVARIGGAFYGPRIGLTYLSPPVQRLADSNGVHTGPVIMQFGWQWEQRFVIGAESPMLASAWVLVVGGAEQGHLLPSLSWLLAVRGTGGGEFGIGPVVSPTGVNLAITAGVSKRHGDVYIPWNVVLVTGKPGLRLSFLTGFNMNRRRLNQ